MQSTREELFAALKKIEKKKILVVGDIILDRYIWGRVDRISPEAPVPVVESLKTEDRLGGAGNVVRNLRGLGVQVSLAGFVGDDDEGRLVLELLDDGDTNRDGVVIDRTRRTTMKTRVVAHTQQVCRIDREDKDLPSVPLQEALGAIVEAQLKDYDAVIVSDYAKGAISGSLLERLKKSFDAGVLGIKSRPLVIDPKPANFAMYNGATIIKPNKKEAEAALGRKFTSPQDAIAGAQELKKRWNTEMMLITLGEWGLVLLTPDNESLHLETTAKEVFDVSGAGDTVTAMIASALSAGLSPRIAGELSNVAAGIVVSEVGTVAIDMPRMVEGIHRLFTKSFDR